MKRVGVLVLLALFAFPTFAATSSRDGGWSFTAAMRRFVQLLQRHVPGQITTLEDIETIKPGPPIP